MNQPPERGSLSGMAVAHHDYLFAYCEAPISAIRKIAPLQKQTRPATVGLAHAKEQALPQPCTAVGASTRKSTWDADLLAARPRDRWAMAHWDHRKPRGLGSLSV